jgi:hypothetical protein
MKRTVARPSFRMGESSGSMALSDTAPLMRCMKVFPIMTRRPRYRKIPLITEVGILLRSGSSPTLERTRAWMLRPVMRVSITLPTSSRFPPFSSSTCERDGQPEPQRSVSLPVPDASLYVIFLQKDLFPQPPPALCPEASGATAPLAQH